MAYRSKYTPLGYEIYSNYLFVDEAAIPMGLFLAQRVSRDLGGLEEMFRLRVTNDGIESGVNAGDGAVDVSSGSISSGSIMTKTPIALSLEKSLN